MSSLVGPDEDDPTGKPPVPFWRAVGVVMRRAA